MKQTWSMLCFLIIIPDVFCEPLFFIFIPCCRGDDGPSSLRFVASLFSFFNSSLLLTFSPHFCLPLPSLGLSSSNLPVLPVVFSVVSVTSLFLCSFRLSFFTLTMCQDYLIRQLSILSTMQTSVSSNVTFYILFHTLTQFSHSLQRLFSSSSYSRITDSFWSDRDKRTRFVLHGIQ